MGRESPSPLHASWSGGWKLSSPLPSWVPSFLSYWLIGVWIGLSKRPCRFAKPWDSRVLSLYIRDPGGKARHKTTSEQPRPPPSSPPAAAARLAATAACAARRRCRLAELLHLLSLVLASSCCVLVPSWRRSTLEDLAGTLVSGNLRRTARAKPYRNCTKFFITLP